MNNRRKEYIIDRAFQYKFSILISLIIIISSIAYPMALYDLSNTFINYLKPLAPNKAAELIKKKDSVLLILIMWQFGFSIITFIISIFFSHRIAGPICHAILFLENIRKGNSQRLTFRKGDYFHNLAEELNKTVDYISNTYQDDFIYLNDTLRYIENLKEDLPKEKIDDLEKIEKHLLEIQSRFKVI